MGTKSGRKEGRKAGVAGPVVSLRGGLEEKKEKGGSGLNLCVSFSSARHAWREKYACMLCKAAGGR